MCGRLACNLQPRDVCNSCCYRDPKNDRYIKPQWRDCYNSGKTYKPSYNVCPTEVAPVLLSGTHFQSSSRLVVPMLFGVIPQWVKVDDLPGGASKYSTINCRIETILKSKLYGDLLKKNQRCVVIANGFYEWQRQGQSKKPYFIHTGQPDEVKVDDPNTWNVEFTPENGCTGFRTLKLAALFEISLDKSLEEGTLSFTIITKEASTGMSWLHERMPAFLETEEQLNAWLNYEEVDADLALNYISHAGSQLLCFPVSDTVNKVTNKDISCVKQNEKKAPSEKSGTKRTSAGLFKEWLEKGGKKKKEKEE